MAKSGKKMKAALEKVDREKTYEPVEAVKLAKETAPAKFDETVDIAVRLGVDPRKADQNIRGSVVLPKGTGKKFRVLVFAKGEKEAEAKKAGAEFVGGEDLVKKIQGGWLEFDRVVATPDMMGQVGKLGKVLGPRGMMVGFSSEGDTQILRGDKEKNQFAVFYLKDGAVVAVDAVNSPREFIVCKQLYGKTVSPDRLADLETDLKSLLTQA